MLTTVAAVIAHDVAPFELGLVCDVFGVDRTAHGVPAMELRVCGEQPGVPLRAHTGISVLPDHGLDAVRGVDLLVVPAHTVREDYPPAILDAIRAAHADGSVVLSVCNGAFLLGAAGLLDQRPCTTHWADTARFEERFPTAKLDPDVLFVDDRDIVTSAGGAAGIDACLHVVRRELGSAVATTIARRMVVPPQRDGGQRQYIDLPVPESSGDSLQPLLDWVLHNLAAEHTVAELARRARLSERTFARRFVAETGTTPNRWLIKQRVLHARRLLEDTLLDIEAIARQCGFSSAALLRHHFRRETGVAPAGYRRSFSSAETSVRNCMQ